MARHEGFLKNAPNKYKYTEQAKSDVLNVFGEFKDLRPSLDGFVFNDGSRKDLLNLDGTIPVNYKGNVYNIPICIWILDTHPYNPPMAYVKPTSDMTIRQGKYVDANGKIDVPYLREWRYPQSDLLGLIHILVIVFSEDPPLFRSSPNRPSYGHPVQYMPYPIQNSPYRSQHTGNACDLCERIGSNWKCVDCDEKYCDHCKLAHAKSKASNHHTITSTNDQDTSPKVLY